jgi:hypothetical protein
MEVEHELRQCPLQPGIGSAQHGETGPRDRAGGSKIQAVAGRAQVHMILGYKCKRPGIAPATNFLIVGLRTPVGHRRMGQIGNFQEQGLEFRLQGP